MLYHKIMNTFMEDLKYMLTGNNDLIELVSNDPKSAFVKISEELATVHKELMKKKTAFFRNSSEISSVKESVKPAKLDEYAKLEQDWLDAERVYWHVYQVEHIVRAAYTFSLGNESHAQRIYETITPSYCVQSMIFGNEDHDCMRGKIALASV